MTPNSFGKERMLFGTKFGYGRWANTSSLGNGFTRVARIKQGEDSVLLTKREGSDHDGGQESRSVGTFLNSDLLFTCIYLFLPTSNGHYSMF